MANETFRLAEYAAQIAFHDVPAEAMRRAKDCLIDAVAVGCRGSRASWIDVVQKYIGTPCPGSSIVFGNAVAPTRAETAALVNGILVHGLEMDCLRKPGVGVHPGAVVVPSALAVAQERGANGVQLLTAIVAGCEVLIRVGKATKHSVEPGGFHAPGVTGPFGSAAAAGRLWGFDATRMAHAFGIAGSMCGGLLQFTSTGGPLVKRLHMGRAAEGGIAAARWAQSGMAGPAGIVEGRHGMLNGFASDPDANLLIDGLGETFETMSICFKRYAAHITAHMPIYAVEVLRSEAGFTVDDVARVTVRGSQRTADHNANRQPTDPISASYSIPFCVAVALYGQQLEPDSFGEASVHHDGMRELRDRITVVKRDGSGGHSDWTAEVEIELKNGTILRRFQEDFPGTPSMPLTPDQLAERFMTLTSPVWGAKFAEQTLDRLENIEKEASLDWLGGLPC